MNKAQVYFAQNTIPFPMGIDVRLVWSLMRRMSDAKAQYGMCVYLERLTKKEICAELGWTCVNTLDRTLAKLVKAQILFRVARGMYRMNPYMFGKGSEQDIAKLRKLYRY